MSGHAEPELLAECECVSTAETGTPLGVELSAFATEHVTAQLANQRGQDQQMRMELEKLREEAVESKLQAVRAEAETKLQLQAAERAISDAKLHELCAKRITQWWLRTGLWMVLVLRSREPPLGYPLIITLLISGIIMLHLCQYHLNTYSIYVTVLRYRAVAVA
eukprot:COSAG06_NODE_11_length_35482_cov_68.929888_13_plen_164_part_00